MKILSILVAFSVNMNFNATQWGLDNVKQFMQFYVVISQNHGASMHLFLRLLQRGKFLKMYDFCSSKDGIRLDIPVWYTNKITIIDFTIYTWLFNSWLPLVVVDWLWITSREIVIDFAIHQLSGPLISTIRLHYRIVTYGEAGKVVSTVGYIVCWLLTFYSNNAQSQQVSTAASM